MLCIVGCQHCWFPNRVHGSGKSIATGKERPGGDQEGARISLVVGSGKNKTKNSAVSHNIL